jgi:GntR family transcriptional regulator/MocR family aminotransferase
MHLILRLQGRRSDRKLVERMAAAGLYGEALSDWTQGGASDPAVLVAFTNIASSRDAVSLAKRLQQIMA